MNWSVLAALALAFALSVRAANPSNTAACLTCHDDKGAAFQASVHSSFSCADCHTTKSSYPHPEKVDRVKCETCHNDPVRDMAASIHASTGKGCQGCHGDAHGVLPASDPKSSTYAANLPRTCGACHGDTKFAKQHNISEVYSRYVDSIHGSALTKDGLLVAASCSSCHGSHKILSNKDPASRTNRANVAETCGKCHAGSKKDYMAGIHGQRESTGNSRAPVCVDCHTTHQIATVQTASWQMKTTATCGGCHTHQMETFRDTFHAQVSALGYIETARCWDCHGSHDIRPATDRNSTIAKANLHETCGKCHSGVNAGFVTYQPHADKHNRQAYPALWASSMFMNMLLASVLGFFALHTLLWLIRSLSERGKSPAEGDMQ